MIKNFYRQFKSRNNLFLYFSACILNLTSFMCGVSFAWSSPIIPKLHLDHDNPFGRPLKEDEISWIASLLPLAAIVGPFAGGYFADKIGRKWTLILAMIPTLVSYLLLAFIYNLYLYYIVRFILGLTSVGIPLAAVPMYIGEVSEIHNRGTLGCFTILYVSIGLLFSFAVGPYTTIKTFNICCAVAPVIFIVVFTILIPETPAYLIMKGKPEEAKKSLTKLRNGCVDKELQDIEEMVKKSLASKGGIKDILKEKYLLKALFVPVGLMVVQQLTAMTVLTFYLQFILESAGLSLSSAVATIIIGVVQLFGSAASTMVVDKLGRRPLLLASTVLTCLSLAVLSIYFYLLINRDVSSLGWLPIVTLVVYRVAYGFGIGSLPQTVLSELFPPNIKSVAASLTVCTCFIFSFVTTKIFPVLVSLVDNWFGFLVFSVANGLGVIFIWFYVPETKGKTLTAILESFK